MSNDTQQTRTQVDALQEIITKQGATEHLSAARGTSSSCEVLAIRKQGGVELKSLKPFLDEYLLAPERRKGTAIAHDLQTLIALSLRHKDDSSVVFCSFNRDKPSMLAVLNYNELGAEGAPRFGDHRVHYSFPFSDEWAAWRGQNDKWMDTLEFAGFVEDHLLDVMNPTQVGDKIKSTLEQLAMSACEPAELMRVSRGLKIRSEQSVADVHNLATGEMEVKFAVSSSNQDGTPLSVPAAFVVGIPVFRNGVRFQVAARLRYDFRGGNLKWKYLLHRWDLVIDTAILDACNDVKEQTQMPVFMGAPEGAED